MLIQSSFKKFSHARLRCTCSGDINAGGKDMKLFRNYCIHFTKVPDKLLRKQSWEQVTFAGGPWNLHRSYEVTEGLLEQGRWGHAFQANGIAYESVHKGATNGHWEIDISNVAEGLLMQWDSVRRWSWKSRFGAARAISRLQDWSLIFQPKSL